jgi:hypothetical protein
MSSIGKRGAVALALWCGALGCTGEGGTRVDEIVPPPVEENRPPIAVAGPDQTVRRGAVVTLDAAASTDPDGDPLTYGWSQLSGAPVTLQDPQAARPSFTAPAASGRLTFSVVASDGRLESAPASVTVDVTNAAPVAVATAASTASGGSAVTLDASPSHDVDGDALTFEWEQRDGAIVVLAGADTARATFTAPASGGALTFAVRVFDGEAWSAAALVAVVVLAPPPANHPPLVRVSLSPAAPDARAELVAETTSEDPDGDALTVTYAWRRNGILLPERTAGRLPASETSPGDLITVSVTASDGEAMATAEATVTIRPAPLELAADAPTEVELGRRVEFRVRAAASDVEAPSDFRLEHGPAGMRVDAAGVVTWTAQLPTFGPSLDVHWKVSAGTPGVSVSGTIVVRAGERTYPLFRGRIRAPWRQAGLHVGDLDGDGRAEALIAGPAGLYELGWTGTGYAQRWAYSIVPTSAVVEWWEVPDAVAARDVDGDGHAEIFFSVGAVLVKLDGARRREVARVDAQPCDDLHVEDLSGDGRVELVCYQPIGWSSPRGSGARIVVYDAATMALLWTSPGVEGDAFLDGSVAVGDVDRDPQLEIVTSTGFVFDGATGATEWSHAPGFGEEIDTGDLDGDGVEEIVGKSGWLYLRGYDAVERRQLFDRFNPDLAPVLVADLDRDGRAEIVIGDQQGRDVAALRYDATTMELSDLFRMDQHAPGIRAFALGDLDGDGAAELLWGGVPSDGRDGIVVAGLGAAPALEWSSSGSEVPSFFVGAKPLPGTGATRVLWQTWNSGAYGSPRSRLFILDPVEGAVTVGADLGDLGFGGDAIDVADVDGDGTAEALLAVADGPDVRLASYDPDRRVVEFTSAATGGALLRITHGELNGDGYPDAVAMTGDAVLAFDVKHGQQLWTIDLPSSGRDVVLADLDQDGVLELVALTIDRVVVFGRAALEDSFVEVGSYAFLQPGLAGGTGEDLLVADCDGDGAPEIYALTSTFMPPSRIRQLDASLRPVALLTFQTRVSSLYAEGVGSGRRNLVLGMGRRLVAIDPTTGGEVWHSPLLLDVVHRDSLTYADLDGDGDLEIAFGTFAGMYVAH